MSAKWVRVSDIRTGHHYTVSERAFDASIHKKLNSAATDVNGNPLPPKAKVPMDVTVNKKSPKTEAPEASEGVK